MSTSSERTTAERVTFVISSLILATIVGLAIWAGIRTGDDSPTFEIQIHWEAIRETNTGYYVPITVSNSGGETAQDVTIMGELDVGATTPETAEVTFMFMAGGETEQAELVFASDPRLGDLVVRPSSFVVP